MNYKSNKIVTKNYKVEKSNRMITFNIWGQRYDGNKK
jgi:hypothetical protein